MPCNTEPEKDAAYWIEKLDLQPHPEGGYYREVYRAAESIPKSALPARFSDARSFATSIYFLLQSHQKSVFHRLKADEIWHFYAGAALEVFTIAPQGNLDRQLLGPDLDRDERFQTVVPAGHWMAGEVMQPDSYTLVGCTVSPGFDYRDFEVGELETLKRLYPQHLELLEKFGR